MYFFRSYVDIKNALNEEEINSQRNLRKTQIANSDKLVYLYDLDVIISVGYRVKSIKVVIFRKWATKVLKEYLGKTYSPTHLLKR